MPEDPLLKNEKPEETKAEPAEGLRSALETLDSLKTSLEDITARIDGIESAVAELKTPTPPQKEPEWTPKSWDEFPAKAREVAEEVVETKLAETKEEEEEKRRIAEEQNRQIDSYIDSQIASLEGSGQLAKVENPDDENDRGRAGRRELLGLAARLGTMSLEKVAETLDILHKAGYTYDPRANNMAGAFMRSGGTPPGISAPVSAPGKSGGIASSKPSYETIHKARSLSDLVNMAMPE